MTVRSLTAKLSLGVVLLVLLSVGLMAGLAVWRSAAALRERALASNQTVALGVAYAVEQHMADAAAIMREAAERPKLRQARVPHAETVGQDFSFRDFFREAIETRRPYLSDVYVSKAAQRPVTCGAARSRPSMWMPCPGAPRRRPCSPATCTSTWSSP